MRVGTSNRTLGKHILLNKIVGREVGMVARGCPGYAIRQYTMLDLCAGDGLPADISETSSPAILCKHRQYLNQHNVLSDLYLVEKNPNTYGILASMEYDATTVFGNALNIDKPPAVVPDKSFMFIHADPNHIEDWPVSPMLLGNSPEYTTLLVTLGCNVGGLKRLPLEIREEWFARMDDLINWMPRRHDAILISLRGDKAQWAYLIIGPAAWRDRYKKDALAAFKYWEYGIDIVGYKEDVGGFKAERNRLFLTTKELAHAQ